MNFLSIASSIFQRRDRTLNFPALPEKPAAFLPGMCKDALATTQLQEEIKVKPSEQAFTLIELMVAMTVLSLMILFLFAVFNQATQAWQASEKKVDAFREARAALYVMRRDIGGLYVTTNLSMNFNMGGTAIPIGAQMQSTNSLFFVSSQSSDAQGVATGGDLCTVGYYVAWSTNEFKPVGGSATDAGVNRSYNLFRYFRDGNDTYVNMSKYWSNLAGSTNLVSKLGDLFPGASALPQGGDEVLARNVVGFTATPYYRVGNTAPQATNGILTNRVAYVQVNLSVINYATANQLGDSDGSSWMSNSASPGMKELVRKNQQNFYNRIPLSR